MKYLFTKKNSYLLLAVFTLLAFAFGMFTQQISQAQDGLISGFGTKCVDNYFDCSTLTGGKFINLYKSLQEGYFKLNKSADYQLTTKVVADYLMGGTGDAALAQVEKLSAAEVNAYRNSCTCRSGVGLNDVLSVVILGGKATLACVNIDGAGGRDRFIGPGQLPYYSNVNKCATNFNTLDTCVTPKQVGAKSCTLPEVDTSRIINSICINTDLIGKDIIPGEITSGITPKICPTGREASQSPQNTTGGFPVWGCCTAGYQYVTLGGLNQAESQGNAACCKIDASRGNDGMPYRLNKTGGATTDACVNKNDQAIWTNQKDANGNYYVEGWSAYPAADSYNSGIYGKSLEVPAPEGEDYITDKSAALLGAAFKCPSGNSCAVTTQKGTVPAGELDSAAGAGLSCIRCYAESEPIHADDVNLFMCNKAGSEDQVPLIRDSISETLAYLKASAENREPLDACRERGGVWVAIGCVDTTPLGLITGVIRIAFGTMGGVALAQLIYVGALLIIGNEKRIEEAKKQVFATFTGIAVLVFSILILRILGVNILDILPQGSI